MSHYGENKSKSNINMSLRINSELWNKFGEYCKHNNTNRTKLLIKFIKTLVEE